MQATIGLEIHAELKTKRKMFCFCKNNPHESEPNTHICPVCMAHPGTLPVPNKEAVRHMIKIGLALGGQIANYSEFDRKSYFYPDIPKAYQISQYKYPIVSGGSLADVEITRVHLEEDTARSIHDSGIDTKVDFNRAGVPLMELVTEPVIESAEQARNFAKELQLLLRQLGASDANMEKGEMRVEANVSIKNPDGSFGTKVEVKNLNSFKSVYQAIEYEIKRQTELLKKGEQVVQETRGWDENKQVTFSQRKKEVAADYRYFPDPDISKLVLQELEEFGLDKLRVELPELPVDIRKRFLSYGLTAQAADFFTVNSRYRELFDAVISLINKADYKLIANYISVDLVGALDGAEPSESLAKPLSQLFGFLQESKISSRAAKDIIRLLISEHDLDVTEYIDKHNLWQVSDESVLRSVLEELVQKNQSAIDDFKAGKEKALGAIIGQAMSEFKKQGVAADPKVLMDTLRQMLA